ncbi:MAG: glycosyltransferase family 39 protein, partial [Fidelibacterota bacterium]
MIINQINKNLIYTVCLLIIGAILYGHTLWFSFTALDDNELIFQNIKKFQDFSNFPNLFLNSIDQSVNAPFYRPLLMVSFVIDSLAGNGSLFSFHFTNLVIHILVSMLVFVFFEMVTNSKKSAFLVAILFLVHPIHTQAVVWIPGRNDTLLTLFSLSAVISLMKYLKTTKTVWFFLNIISFLFAMYTKEQAVLLIFIFGYLSYSSYKNSKFLALFLLWAATSLLFLIPRSLIMAGDFIFNIQSYPIFMAGIIKAFIISVGKVVLPVYQSVLPSTSSTPIWPGILSIMVILILTFTGKILNRH